jgi:hypothetical protein
MRRTYSILILSGVLVAALVCGFQWNSSRRQSGAGSSAGLGEVLAQEVVRLSSGNGEVIVISPFLAQYKETSAYQQVSSFSDALSRLKAKPPVIERLPKPVFGGMDGGSVSEAELMRLLERHPAAKVMVCFAALPPLTKRAEGALRERNMQLVFVGGNSANLRHWMSKGLVTSAIVPRPRQDGDAGSSPQSDSAFESQFQLITSSNVAALGL